MKKIIVPLLLLFHFTLSVFGGTPKNLVPKFLNKINYSTYANGNIALQNGDVFGLKLDHFASGAIGGAVSVANPFWGGSITAAGNLAVDVANGNLPDLSDGWDLAKYSAGLAIDGLGASGSGAIGKSIAKKLGRKIGEEAVVKVSSTVGKTVSNFGEDIALSSISQYDVLVKPANLAFGNSLASEAGQWAKGGTTVLGKYPDYINLAEKLGANRFNIPTNIWNRLTPAEQWASNTKFLDRMIARGDKIILSNPVLDINKVSGAFRQELDYLINQGYRINSTGTKLIK